jgi:hypothetical protein
MLSLQGVILFLTLSHELDWNLQPLIITLVLILIMGCFHSKKKREPVNHEDPTILASETACESPFSTLFKTPITTFGTCNLSLSLSHFGTWKPMSIVKLLMDKRQQSFRL